MNYALLYGLVDELEKIAQVMNASDASRHFGGEAQRIADVERKASELQAGLSSRRTQVVPGYGGTSVDRLPKPQRSLGSVATAAERAPTQIHHATQVVKPGTSSLAHPGGSASALKPGFLQKARGFASARPGLAMGAVGAAGIAGGMGLMALHRRRQEARQ
jgi:hypothetical protein